MNTLAEVAQFLREHDDYIIVGHENPDPDSIGSMLGLYYGLVQMNKRCRMVSADPIPKTLTWTGLELIEHIPEGIDAQDRCVIVLDCEPGRTGTIAPEVQKAKFLVNLDHHRRDRGIGHIVYVNPDEAATSTIVYHLLGELGVELNLQIATPLYGGIVGDTGGFRHANTSAEILAIAGKLLEYKVNPATVAREIFSSYSLNYLRMLGYALSKLETALNGRLVWLALTYEDFLKFDVSPEEADQFISYVRMLKTAEISMIFRETAPNQIRLGLRAYQIDIQKLASSFGGGGHKLASGARFEGELQTIIDKVVEAAKNYLITGEINERNS